MKQQNIVIYGYGGYGRELAFWLENSKVLAAKNFIGFIDDVAISSGGHDSANVMPFSELCDKYSEAKIVVSVSDIKARECIVKKCINNGFTFDRIIDKDVLLPTCINIGQGSTLCRGVVITPNVVLGEHTHVNMNCTIGHDAVIGDFVTLAPGVHISGNVHIRSRVSIGTGATIINGTPDKPLIINEGCVIGAGACVVGSLAVPGTYVGVPAKRVRNNSCDNAAKQGHVENARQYGDAIR